MDRYAIFLDAGYFYAAGAKAAKGSQVPRNLISLKNPAQAVLALSEATSKLVGGLQLLRAYWYDAMPGPRLSLEQSGLALLPFIKLRLGVLNSSGEQKGVDSLIVTDLIDLARNRAIADAVIVSGDEDLRVAVQVAQSFGVRVHLLAAGDPRSNVSASLQMESDSVGSLDEKWFKQHFDIAEPKPASVVTLTDLKTPGPAASAASPKASASLDAIAEKVCLDLLSGLAAEKIAALQLHFNTSTSVPPELDKHLIGRTSLGIERRLASGEMRHIRGIFVKAVRAAKT